MPIAVVALAVSGAFMTTSMQSAAKISGLQTGFKPNPDGTCSNMSAQCENTQTANLCYIGGGISGVQAFGKDPLNDNCSVTLWRPVNP